MHNSVLRKLLAVLFAGFVALFGAAAAQAQDYDGDYGGDDTTDTTEDTGPDSLARTGDDLMIPLSIGGGLVATALATRRLLGARR